MKRTLIGLLFTFFICAKALPQKYTPLPHGMVYGSKPSTVSLIPASQLHTYMGKRSRTSAAIVGKVLKVTKAQGGWFTLDAGKGNIITAHFKNYNISLPLNLKGREVIISGTATKQFNAFDAQRQAGDRRRSSGKPSTQYPLSFEVVGLMVNK